MEHKFVCPYGWCGNEKFEGEWWKADYEGPSYGSQKNKKPMNKIKQSLKKKKSFIILIIFFLQTNQLF